MKKIILTLLLLVSFFSVNAIAFAEVSLQESRSFFNVDLNMSPMIVKTIKGKEVTGGVHRFKDMASLDEFFKGKGEKGLRVTNSYEPKLNVVIMDSKDVGNVVTLADMATTVTLYSKLEGPLYQIQEVPVVPPKKVIEKMKSIGIKEPKILLVASGKKRIPGGIWKNLISQAITIVTLL